MMRSFAFSSPEWSASRTLLGQLEVDDLFAALGPRQRDQPVEIGPRDRVFRRGDRHLGEPVEFPQRLFLDRFRHAGGFDLLGQLLDVLGLIVAFAELLLDRLHLLAKEVFALVLADLGLHLRLNLRPELEDLELLDQDPVERVEPRPDVERLEHLLLDRRADRRQRRGDEVRQPSGLGDVHRQRLEIVREQRRQRHDLLKVRLDVPGERVDLEAIGVLDGVRRGADARPDVRIG